MSLITNTRIRRDLQLHDGALVHAYWQCTDHARQYLLRHPKFKELYLNILADKKKHYGISLIDVALMDNHFHFFIRIRTVREFSTYLQSVNTSFAKLLNHAIGRTGSVVELRVKAQVVEETDEAVLGLQVYLALNRWHCAKKTRPEHYRFSGYRHYAGLEQDPRFDSSEAWLSLGESDETRAAAYKDLVEAKRLEGRGNDEDLLEPSKLYFGSPEFSLSRTERLLIAVREHHRALRQVRKLRLFASDAATSKKD
ncbi:MAG: hypothetical protein A2284_19295 [Deltaproteobacteria bacterium RIFOXYA12_FULL_61_11]|nr:MAG: hypothetical protein A2284_19295 [Deltaproteobacteria bacterium RIFOXYA12_FULL_61_11]